jgi:toxin YoeB
MPYKLIFCREAHDDLEELRKGNKQDYVKCFDLILAVLLDARNGIGKPERLKHSAENTEIFSRRVNEKDRLVYLIDDETETIEILICKGHYDDK